MEHTDDLRTVAMPGHFRLESQKTVRLGELAISRFLQLCAYVSVITTIGIIVVLLSESRLFFEHVSVTEFFFGTHWSPLIEPRSFGVLPLLWGTVLISLIACCIAVPLGLGGAIYLAEYASPLARRLIKPAIELLAGIPSVVFGYFAITVITPTLQWFIPSTEVFNGASAAMTLGIMVVPVITTLCDDAIRSVPRSIADGGYAVAATKSEICIHLLLPASMSSLMASFILGFSRAVGETMAVSLAAGSTPNLSLNPFTSMQTMTGYIVQVALGDVPHGSIEYQSIFAVALSLFIITLSLNVFSQFIIRRFARHWD